MFTSNRSFWLEADRNTFLIRDHSGLREARSPRKSRMERDGWVLRTATVKGQVFEKTIREGWILRKVGRDDGCLRSAAIGTYKLGPVHTVYDFNGMVPVRADRQPG